MCREPLVQCQAWMVTESDATDGCLWVPIITVTPSPSPSCLASSSPSQPSPSSPLLSTAPSFLASRLGILQGYKHLFCCSVSQFFLWTSPECYRLRGKSRCGTGPDLLLLVSVTPCHSPLHAVIIDSHHLMTLMQKCNLLELFSLGLLQELEFHLYYSKLIAWKKKSH